jgi:hypothetical protein
MLATAEDGLKRNLNMLTCLACGNEEVDEILLKMWRGLKKHAQFAPRNALLLLPRNMITIHPTRPHRQPY